MKGIEGTAAYAATKGAWHILINHSKRTHEYAKHGIRNYTVPCQERLISPMNDKSP